MGQQVFKATGFRLLNSRKLSRLWGMYFNYQY
jgi:hypothetical protein